MSKRAKPKPKPKSKSKPKPNKPNIERITNTVTNRETTTEVNISQPSLFTRFFGYLILIEAPDAADMPHEFVCDIFNSKYGLFDMYHKHRCYTPGPDPEVKITCLIVTPTRVYIVGCHNNDLDKPYDKNVQTTTEAAKDTNKALDNPELYDTIDKILKPLQDLVMLMQPYREPDFVEVIERVIKPKKNKK